MMQQIIKQATKENSMVTNYTKPVPEEPKTFNEAWDHLNANSCAKWQEAICKEFDNMKKQQVWYMTGSYAPKLQKH